MVHGVGRGLMDLDPPLCGRRPSGPQLPATGRSLSACRIKMPVPFERSAKDSCFLQATSVPDPSQLYKYRCTG